MTRVVYLCDGKACEHCHVETDYCTHTSDIKHAINFDEVAPDRYMEVPEPTPYDFVNTMSPEIFKIRMLELSNMDDEELRHKTMDHLMCDVLRGLGYGEGIIIFETTPKWWA